MVQKADEIRLPPSGSGYPLCDRRARSWACRKEVETVNP